MMLPNISEFIKTYVTKREHSFFENDLINNKEKLLKEIEELFTHVLFTLIKNDY